MQAYCLVEGGPLSGQYTVNWQGCDKGKINTYGAVDTPYKEAEIAGLYAKDEAERTEDSNE